MGVAPILRAFRLFARERELWRYAFVPLLWGGIAYLVVVLLVLGFSIPLGGWLAQSLLGGGGLLGEWLGGLLGFVTVVVFGGGIYLALVALLSGFGFDRLSVEVERREFGSATMGESTVGGGLVRGAVSLALGLVALCLGGTVVVPWLVASYLCLMDFTAPALARRGVGFGAQFRATRGLPGALPFALVGGVILLVPVVNVLALPVLVAAGTMLVAGYSPPSE